MDRRQLFGWLASGALGARASETFASSASDPTGLISPVGDGIADDTKAIGAFVDFALRRIIPDPFGEDPLSTVELRLPPGTFRITASEALLPSSATHKARGYRLIGAGPGLTQVIFAPTSGSRCLMSNNGAFLQAQVEGITFLSASAENTFLHSHNQNPPGAAQRWSFRHCEWSGEWSRGVYLTGNDNNSEWSFEDCGVSGHMGRFIYVPNDATASDQFLNFWFNRFKFWPTSATPRTNCLVDMGRGGHVRIAQSDFSGFRSGVLFSLKGTSHAYGVCHFSLSDSRIELHSADASVLESEWPQGSIVFDRVDLSSQAPSYPPDTVSFRFDDVNFAGASATFRDCTLIGAIAFAHGSNDFECAKATVFENCDFPQRPDLFRAFQFLPGTNDFGGRAVRFRNCRGSTPMLSSFPHWAARTAYAAGQIVRLGPSAYECSSGGVSGQTGPMGKADRIADGSVVWRWAFNNSRDYISDATYPSATVLRPSGLARRIALFGGLLPSADAAQELILPPNVIVTAACVTPGRKGNEASATAPYRLENCDEPPLVLIDFNSPEESPGVLSWKGALRLDEKISRRAFRLISRRRPAEEGFAYVEYIG
jgi:hypothetical protein